VTRLQDTVGSEATARDRRRLTATVVLGPTDLGSVVEAVSTAPAAAAATVLACSTRSPPASMGIRVSDRRVQSRFNCFLRATVAKYR
jgi:hypothetical protein